MARPLKTGLEYFPLDVDIDQDDKVSVIDALYGLEGFCVVIKLLMKIYKEGYFYNWTKREQLIFSRRINVDINLVNDIVNDCINEGLFSKDVYEMYHILTSKGIQKRFLEAVKRRKQVEFIKEYFLIDDTKAIIDVNKIDIVYINTPNVGVNVNINTVSDDINDDISTQSKGKDSIGENNRENINGEKHSSPKQVYDDTSIFYQLSVYFFERIKENNPDHKKPNLQKWSDDIRKMVEIDNRTEEQIKYLMKWVQQDDFEKVNVLSPSKLRSRFDQLIMKVKQGKAKQKGGSIFQQGEASKRRQAEIKPLTAEEIEMMNKLEEELPY